MTDSERIQARNDRVMANQGLVFTVARRFQGRGVEMPELVQMGSLGLLTAASRYDPSWGIAFSTYAFHWVARTIRLGLIEQANLVRVPESTRKLVADFRLAWKTLAEGTGAMPSFEQVTSTMALSPRRCARLRDALAAMRVEVEMNPAVVVATRPAEAGIEDERQSERLREALERLPAFQRQILVDRFGLGGAARQSRGAIGKRIGRSAPMVANYEKKAVEKLRFLMRRELDASA